MKTYVKQMSKDAANQISKWFYEEPYAMYSMDGSEECMRELLNGKYFSVTDIENNIIGDYCFGEAAQVPVGRELGIYDDKSIIDIGLGIKPNLCGKGLGFEFLNNGLEFGKNQFQAKGFRLTVASFNKRAIEVYERVGFKQINSFIRTSEIGEIEFLIMILKEEAK